MSARFNLPSAWWVCRWRTAVASATSAVHGWRTTVWGAMRHTVRSTIRSATTAATSRTSCSSSAATSVHARKVCALRDNLDSVSALPPRLTFDDYEQRSSYLEVAAPEHALVEDDGVCDKAGLLELDVGVTLGVTGELVEKNGDAVDVAAALEVGLNLFWRGAVVDVADKDAARINVLLVFAQAFLLLVKAGLHLAKLRRLGLHLLHPLLHVLDLGLILILILVQIKLLVLAFNLGVGHPCACRIDSS